MATPDSVGLKSKAISYSGSVILLFNLRDLRQMNEQTIIEHNQSELKNVVPVPPSSLPYTYYMATSVLLHTDISSLSHTSPLFLGIYSQLARPSQTPRPSLQGACGWPDLSA